MKKEKPQILIGDESFPLIRGTIYIRNHKITTPQELEEALKKLEEEKSYHTPG